MTPYQAPQRREVIYCAGPFSGTETHSQAQNITRAMAQGERVRALGLVPVVPHAAILPGCSWQDGQDECLELVQRADGLLLLEDWTLSRGALEERALAEALHLTVYDGLSALETAHAQGVPVTLSGRLRRFWMLLEELAAREVKAGFPHPAQRPMPWILKLGLWRLTINPFPAPVVLNPSGVTIPSHAAALDYAGGLVGMVAQGGADLKDPDMLPGLLKALERETAPREVAS